MGIWTPVTPCAPAANLAAGGAAIIMEQLVITAPNTLPNLSQVPNGMMMLLIVNGATLTTLDSFSISGTSIVWGTGPFGVNPGDTVIAVYTHD
jgi:hypothetical protein